MTVDPGQPSTLRSQRAVEKREHGSSGHASDSMFGRGALSFPAIRIVTKCGSTDQIREGDRTTRTLPTRRGIVPTGISPDRMSMSCAATASNAAGRRDRHGSRSGTHAETSVAFASLIADDDRRYTGVQGVTGCEY